MDEGCLTKAAYKAINGENRKYPSDNAGFKKLFDSYGTHVIKTATLGGRLTIATTINTSDISDEYNLDAFAKLSYSGVVDVSNEVKDEYKNSFKNNSSACNTKISALGGSSAIFSDLSDLVGDGAKNAANAWFTSLNEEESTWTFISIDNMENLIPIWDLVEDGERAELMQEYFESGQYAQDVTKGVSYELGVQAVITDGLPEFDVLDTQIADIKIGENNNKTVARVCNEFIPALDETAPVKVIYPVINGNVKWNMGWFVGNDYLPPHSVVNTNGKIKVEAIKGETEKGEATEIYIRGMRIATTPVDEETESQSTSVVPFFERMMKQDKVDDYRVVKILDNIWLAENFAGTKTADGKDIKIFHGDLNPIKNEYNIAPEEEVGPDYNNDWYYYDFTIDSNTFLTGWARPTKAQMQAIIDMLAGYENIDKANAFKIGGCLRFNGRDSGYYEQKKYDKKTWFAAYDGAKGYYLALEVHNDKCQTETFMMNFTDGSCGFETLTSEKKTKTDMYPHATPVRLCKPIQ
jgi:hypothetical protein